MTCIRAIGPAPALSRPSTARTTGCIAPPRRGGRPPRRPLRSRLLELGVAERLEGGAREPLVVELDGERASGADGRRGRDGLAVAPEVDTAAEGQVAPR